MIITCKCCKFKFLVKKKDIPQSGRKVRCGICDTEWLYIPGIEGDIIHKHYFAKFILFCVFSLSSLGLLFTFKKNIITIFPNMNIIFDKFTEIYFKLGKYLNEIINKIILITFQLL